MSIDLSRVTGISDSRGVITEIKDSLGRVIWAVSGGKAVLMVEKITDKTYAGETTYENEQFILLDIYPKTNGTVKVTYGGLTKTITDTSGAAEPNAQQVFFGTFNGVTDSVATPASGELTIKGDFAAFGAGRYEQTAKITGYYCSCITAIAEWGEVTFIPANAFRDCTSLALTSLPSDITSIGSYAFYNCNLLALTSLPSDITSIESNTFNGCTSLALTSLPNGVTSIGEKAFNGCTKLALGDLSNTKLTSIGRSAFESCLGMANVIIPETVTSLGALCLRCKIGEFVFPDGSGGDGYNLTNVRMLGTTPPVVNAGQTELDNGYITAFGEVRNDMKGIITVPKGSGQAYKTDPEWKHLEGQIVEAT